MKFTHAYFVCQSACLPAISSISGGRIGSVLSHNVRYQCTTTDLLIWLWFIPCNIVSHVILHCFSFFLTGKWKDEKLLKRYRWIVMAYTYYTTLMAKCMCTWLHHPLKLLTSTMYIAMYGFKSVRMVSCWDLYVCCDLPIQLLLKLLSSVYNDRSVYCFYHVLIHYTIFSILCLNKINRLAHFYQ